jgi:hypothetical protein
MLQPPCYQATGASVWDQSHSHPNTSIFLLGFFC